MKLTSTFFGRTQNGEDVYLHTMENANGMRVEVIEYGCAVRSIIVPDRTRAARDVVLGYQTLEDYELATPSVGAFVGRVANRIENAVFTVDGKTYHLQPNSGKNHLHGVLNKTVFRASAEGDSLVLTYTSPDGEEGFPGTVDVRVAYTLTDENALVMDYTATTDKTTILNFTNHSYFNLEGAESGSALDQTLVLRAKEFCEGNAETCPTGRILPVAGTPFDFTQEKPIGRDIFADDEQLKLAHGYDHNYVLDKDYGELGLVATAYSARTGIVMETYTTQPGMQLYTANFLGNDTRPGKTGAMHANYQAFCLETQHYPCAPSHPEFPSIEVTPDEEYHETTIYKFLVR